MFSNLFFIIMILLLISGVSSGGALLSRSEDPGHIVVIAVTFYVMFLALIAWQNYWFKRILHFSNERLIFLSNIELIFLFLVLFYCLEIQGLYLSSSLNSFKLSCLTITTLLAYFFGLAVSHFSCEIQHSTINASIKKTWKALRFLLPFTIPFIVFVFLGEVITILNMTVSEPLQMFILPMITVGSMALVMVFFPPLIVWVWRCKELEDSELKNRLIQFCEKVNFKYAEFKIWSVMEGSMTAAIIGIIKPFRYIMFTPKLLHRLNVDEVEAVLAHEIGHCRHKHLMIYPFILLGMGLTGMIVSAYSTSFIRDVFSENNTTLESLVSLISLMIAAALYFRYVFGYFSRLFERQADLAIFEMGVDPKHLIKTLIKLSNGSGINPLKHNWHHFGIQERIDFINAVDKNPQLFFRYQNKVKYSLVIYFIIFLITSYAAY